MDFWQQLIKLDEEYQEVMYNHIQKTHIEDSLKFKSHIEVVNKKGIVIQLYG